MARERDNHNWTREPERNNNSRERGFQDRKKTDNFRGKINKFRSKSDGYNEESDRFGSKGGRFRKKDDRFSSRGDRKERGFNKDYKRKDFSREQNSENPRRPRIKPKRAIDSFREENYSQTKRTEDIRLNKYIANAGICSRREADVLITTGVISVNGKVVTQLGYKVKPDDVVKYNGRTLKDEKKVYILLNKPKGFITTSDDPQQRRTVMELIDGACRERVYPVGRLDRMTTGLLLLTNDGELTKKLTHPSYGAQKVYNVDLDKPLRKEDMSLLLEGVELEDGLAQVDDINYLNQTPIDKKKVGVSIHSGKNRIIRRMFESLGYQVKKLDRVYFAGLTKKNLLRGKYRFLDEKEVGFLYMNTSFKG